MKCGMLGILAFLMLAACQHSSASFDAIPEHPHYSADYLKAAAPELEAAGPHVQEIVVEAVKYYKALDASNEK